MFIFDKSKIYDDDIFKDREALCFDCVEDANSRAKKFVGYPTALLSLFAIFCLVYSVFGILDAMDQVDMDSGMQVDPEYDYLARVGEN